MIMGQFIIGQDGGFAGADLSGVIYTGIARENDVGWITLDIQLTFRRGQLSSKEPQCKMCRTQILFTPSYRPTSGMATRSKYKPQLVLSRSW
jgi:hypothetical protein